MEAPCSRFTPAEGGARLAATAGSKNTLAVEYGSFISTRMIYEDAYKIRGSLFDGKQRSLYITRATLVDVVAYELNILTDLKVTKAHKYEDLSDWAAELETKEVLVCTSDVIRQILEEGLLSMNNINVMVVDSSHLVGKDISLQYIMKCYKECVEENRPRVLALTYPLFSYPKKDATNNNSNAVSIPTSDENVPTSEEKRDTETQLNTDNSENLPKVEEISDNVQDSADKLPEQEETTKTTEEMIPIQEESTKITEENMLTQEETAITTVDNLPQQEKTTITMVENLPKHEEITITTVENLPKQEETTIKTVENLQKQEETTTTTVSKTTPENSNSKTTDADQMGVYENLDDFQMYEKLEWKIEQLEKELCCQMDLAEDIDGGKRLSATLSKPKEVIIEHGARHALGRQPRAAACACASARLERYMRAAVQDATDFLDEHRYDPTEIYGEDLYEEFMNIPNPVIEPKYIFKQFLYVLDELGPYAADKAAFSLLTKLEKLKIKVPYERHFLLLCLCTSLFVKIRCYADLVFSKYESDWEKIQIFCSPKVLRFAEILEKFCPENNENSKSPQHSKETNKVENNESVLPNEGSKADDKSLKTNEMLEAIQRCDFISLSNQIEDKVNTYEANLKDLDDVNIKTSKLDPSQDATDNVENRNEIESIPDNKTEPVDAKNKVSTADKDNKNLNKDNNTVNENNNLKSNPQSPQKVLPDQRGIAGRGKRLLQRGRGGGGGGRAPRSGGPGGPRAHQLSQSPDALCGIVFMKEPLMAKIMFLLVVDMSRSHPKLSYICCQYCAVEQPADPASEPRECQRQGKKQEDVLKKFRMHECNLLLCTCALEDGIDLPRCNLVLRWDVPASYRSYGLCRSRARAPRAACALLARRADTSALLHHVAVYRELDQIISRKCGCGIQDEPPLTEEEHADSLTHLVKPYTPSETETSVYRTTNITNNMTVQNKNSREIETKTNNQNEVDKNSDNNQICNKYNDKKPSLESVCSANVINSTENNDSKKIDNIEENIASVDLSTAIALINRYCGKLPSDTFTRLAPQWWVEEVQLPARNTAHARTAYICTLRLPLNCPVKHNIVGHPMPTRALSRRVAALQACRVLHRAGELDHQLMPIGKEGFKAAEVDATGNFELKEASDCARPGTTKRRQYYYKRTAWAFTDCQPVVDCTDEDIERGNPGHTDHAASNEQGKQPGTKRNMLYAIVSKLWCALPERYNTRGRRLHAPQHASQAIGILMAREEPDNLQIPAFPVYTRSGEVRVCVEHAADADVRVSPRRGRLVRRFMRFVFAEVLRVRRRGMRLQSDGSAHNNYYIVPTVKTLREDGTTKIDVDWAFLELIYKHTEDKKLAEIERPNIWTNDEEEDEQKTTQAKEGDRKGKKSGEVKKMDNPLLAAGETFVFDADKYREAVVTPWYRNQDQPQFFLVAEICWNLSPDSAFPSALHTTFRQYYQVKYGVQLTQTEQPLLDVDHTSNRLNLLTPRYVNRKGVALPVSSERTRRAKRDRLDQKQILVPELCRVHPFAAPLWFATVALPCVLYRINALLIADEIRRSVAIDVGLGIPKIDDNTCPGFQWPALDFGWSLAEVLSADSEKNEKKKLEEDSNKKEDKDIKDKEESEVKKEEGEDLSQGDMKEKTINDILQEKECTENAFEIGTWSNEMASSIPLDDEYDEYMEPLPPNLTFCTSASGGANWCDPVQKPKSQFQPSRNYNMADSDCSYMSSDMDTDDSSLDSDASDDDTSGFCSGSHSNVAMGVRIEYKTAREAEAVDLERKKLNPAPQPDEEDDAEDRRQHEQFIRAGDAPREYIERFRVSVAKHEKEIVENGSLIKEDQPLVEILPEPAKESQKLSRDDLIKLALKTADNLTLKTTDNLTLKTADNLALKTTDDLALKTTDNLTLKTADHLALKTTDDLALKTADDLALKTADNLARMSIDDRSLKTLEKVKKDCSGAKDFHLEKLKENIKESIDAKLDEKVSEIILTKKSDNELNEIADQLSKINFKNASKELLDQIFPYGNSDLKLMDENGQISLKDIEKNKRVLLTELKNSLPKEEIQKLNCFSMVDVDIDAPNYVNEKIVNVGFDKIENYKEKVEKWRNPDECKPYYLEGKSQGKDFDFDYQPNLEGHPGPSPSVILQALTMSNANDGINLERLETIGDSFLKFAITAYLYCAHPTVHEGKLSHMRSKQVSNLNLYRLGRNKRLGARMIASKFEPHDNWLPPCHKPPATLQPRMSDKDDRSPPNPDTPLDNTGCFIPYNLITQHSIPDKSIADCVEALIGAYLLECGVRGALLFMSWLGIRVLPSHDIPLSDDHPYVRAQSNEDKEQKPVPAPSSPRRGVSSDTDSAESDTECWLEQQDSPSPDWTWPGRPLGSLRPYRDKEGRWKQTIFGELKAPPSPLLRYIADPEGELERMLSGYDALESTLQYRFRDRALLLQALTHASHQQNRLTDCYQRLEFLGDAILDYLITRHLYEDPRRHSPGALTDLRSALVNNTIFATLAARHGFHKHFRHMSPGLNEVLSKYVKIQEENGHSISEEHYLIQEDEMEQAEDVEVPKALGDLFESVAGAIFLDSGMSLSAVWRSYVTLMGAELEAFSAAAPKSPVRELLEAEPDTAKFGKPERLADGRRVRVSVEVFGRGAFKGVGRNYRIAKGTAARCALRHLKIHRQR